MPKYLVIDSESSGLFDYSKPADAEGQPRLAHLGMIFVDESLAVEREASFLIRPDGWTMPKEAEAINGLSTELLMAKGVPVREALLAYSFAIDAGYVVVAHNAQHDCKTMRAELRRAGVPDLFEKTSNICTMRALVGVCKIPNANGRNGYKFPKLAEAMAHFKVPQEGAHTAMGDARSALTLFRKLVEIGCCPEPAVYEAKEGTKAGKARAARGKPEGEPDPTLPLGEALVQSAGFCTYPRCKCIVSTSTSQPEPICKLGLPAAPKAVPLANQELPT